MKKLGIYIDMFRGKRKQEGGKRKREDIATKIVMNCPNLKSLNIDDCECSPEQVTPSFWAVLSERQLEKLAVGMGIPLDIPLHSKALRELTLKGYSIDASSTNLWEKIGSCLEKLQINHSISAPNGLDNIKQHCPNLKSIRMEANERKDVKAVANLMAFYGDQLEFADLSYLNQHQLKRVSRACPNARFHLDVSDDLTVARLNIVGPRLESISLTVVKMGKSTDEWKEAWSMCVNLRELVIHHGTVQDFEVIFSTPKEQLKDLQFRIFDTVEAKDVKKVMSLCAEGTECIENFKYEGPKFFQGWLNKKTKN